MRRLTLLLFAFLIPTESYNFILQPLLNVTDCGIPGPENFEYEKDKARCGQYPWMVGILFEKTGQLMCSGTLITPRHVVTAAHCFRGLSIFGHVLPFITLGYADIELNGTLWMKIENLTIDTNYNASISEFSNDIVVLKLEKPLRLTKNVRPICIPAGADQLRLIREVAYITGWGHTELGTRSETLRFSKHRIIDNEECQHRLGQRFDFEGQFCASIVNSTNRCRIDYGGPVSLKDIKGRHFQIGITQLIHTQCLDIERPATHTRIVNRVDFIVKAIRDMGDGAEYLF